MLFDTVNWNKDVSSSTVKHDFLEVVVQHDESEVVNDS